MFNIFAKIIPFKEMFNIFAKIIPFKAKS